MPIRLGRFEMPNRLAKDENVSKGNYAKFVAEPFEAGYGHTLGNSLRRVLLSSLEGAAISSLKLEGAVHEFGTLPGVVEDVTEKRRLAIERGWRSRLAELSDRLSLQLGHLMGPLVVPFAGGVFSAVVLFGVMLSTYPAHASAQTDFDVPTMLTTSAGVKGTGPISTGDDGDVVVVDISLDGQGRMVDYAIVSGAAVLQNTVLRRRLENMLLFTEFVPATAFGKPTTSRLRLPLLSSRIEHTGQYSIASCSEGRIGSVFTGIGCGGSTETRL